MLESCEEKLYAENELLGREARKIVEGLRKMFAPCCEVVLYDLVQSEHAHLSDRQRGEVEGGPVKSASIDLRNSSGQCVASISLSLELPLSKPMGDLSCLLALQPNPISVSKVPVRSHSDICRAIEAFAVQHNMQPQELRFRHRRQVIQLLDRMGLLQLRGAIGVAAKLLGVSRGSVYNALK